MRELPKARRQTVGAQNYAKNALSPSTRRQASFARALSTGAQDPRHR